MRKNGSELYEDIFPGARNDTVPARHKLNNEIVDKHSSA